MSSFYAELTLDGQTPYPLRQCQFEFMQATDPRGRAAAKVRHGLLHLTLGVPEHDQLLDWANTVHKPLSGHVTFFEDDRRTARETLSFAAGQCVSYQETFAAGDGEVGAYVCQLIITSDGLTLAPGGAAQAFVAPAARDHGVPAVGSGLRNMAIGGTMGAPEPDAHTTDKVMAEELAVREAQAQKLIKEQGARMDELLRRFNAKKELLFRQANSHHEGKVNEIRKDSETKQAEYNEAARGRLISDRKRFRIGKDQNIAYAEGTINGERYDVVSHSGYLEPIEGTILPTPVEKQKLRTFPTKGDHKQAAQRGEQANPERRAHDSEVKILEDLLRNTSENPGCRGDIKLVSELPVCESCSGALQQFRQLRPNIRIRVWHAVK